MTLINHAKSELKAAGICGSEMDDAMARDVLELIEVFSRQGHSGFSASYAISLFTKLARFEPLRPLSGADDEWNEVADGVWQNRRCSHVFKEAAGSAYDIQAVVFEEPDGCRFTSGKSRRFIEFPYTPTSEIVKVGPDGEPLAQQDAA